MSFARKFQTPVLTCPQGAPFWYCYSLSHSSIVAVGHPPTPFKGGLSEFTIVQL